MTQQAMQSYLALGGNEIVNAARLKAYVDNGLAPGRYSVRAIGCAGLTGILPCLDCEVPECGYQLPELDDAPWYDPTVPESKDFAGLLVTSATVSAPYSRVVSSNIGDGQVLGRQKLNGRSIVVTGWLIGRTCCSVSYGLSWLASAIGDNPCADMAGCGGADLDFLSCCPEMCQGEGCLRVCTDDDIDCVSEVYVRADEESEWQRGTDFWRRFKGTGVVDGPNVLDCHGATCGCGSGSLVQVEFTLATSKPYAYHMADSIIKDLPIPACPDDACDDCDIKWVLGCTDGGCGCLDSNDECIEPGVDECNINWDLGCTSGGCIHCSDDPNCPFPTLPPSASDPVPVDQCGCLSMCTSSMIVPVSGERKWGSSVLNIDVSAGSRPMRNMRIYLINNPTDGLCSDLIDQECNAFGSFLIDYIPAGGILHVDGETKQITVDCANGSSRDAGRNVTDVTGTPFAWPEITCDNICVKFTFDCNHLSSNATISIDRVDRDL